MAEKTFDKILWKAAGSRNCCKGCSAVKRDIFCKLVVVDGTEGYFIGTLLKSCVRCEDGEIACIDSDIAEK